MRGSGPPFSVVGVSPAAGDKPQPYRGRRCRRRCWVPALPRPVVGVSPAAGDKPQPYIRTAALPPAAGDGRRRYIRTVIIVSAAVGDECRRCGVPALRFRWSVFRRRRGTSPSPTLGRRCRRRRGTSASPRVVFDSPCVAFGRATFLGRDNDPDEFETKTVESWVRRSKSWRLRRHFRGACAVAEGYWLRLRAFDLV